MYLQELIKFAYDEKIVLMADEVYQENIYQDERPFVSARKVRGCGLGCVTARLLCCVKCNQQDRSTHPSLWLGMTTVVFQCCVQQEDGASPCESWCVFGSTVHNTYTVLCCAVQVMYEMGEPYKSGVELLSFHTVSKVGGLASLAQTDGTAAQDTVW